MTRELFTSLRLCDWPAMDRRLWIEAQQTSRLFGARGFASKWRPATIRNCEQNYGVFLAWLASEGMLDSTSSPSARVTEERVRAFLLRYSVGRSEHTIAGAIRGTAYVMRAFDSPDGLPWLTKLAHQLSNEAQPCNSKAAQVAPIPDIIAVSEKLMDLGATLLAKGHTSGAPTFRDGLMIGLLIRRPMRVKNLAALRLGSSIFLEGKNGGLQIGSDQTKAGVAIDCSVPQDLMDALTYYVGEVRPVLLRRDQIRDDGWLWLGRRGSPMPPTDIAARISRQTYTQLGRAISPHRFRDCAATDIALNEPRLIGMTKSVLGHRTLATSQKYYNQADSFSAFERYREVIRKARASFRTS